MISIKLNVARDSSIVYMSWFILNSFSISTDAQKTKEKNHARDILLQVEIQLKTVFIVFDT